MKPLIILISVFVIALFATKIFGNDYKIALSGRIAMSCMLLFTALGHFICTKGMTMMLPDFLPLKTEAIYFTGFFEIAVAICLLFPKLQILSGWLLILFFVLMLPANIYASIKHIDYQKANFEGNGINYLWFRIPLQIVFIIWTYFSTIKN